MLGQRLRLQKRMTVVCRINSYRWFGWFKSTPLSVATEDCLWNFAPLAVTTEDCLWDLIWHLSLLPQKSVCGWKEKETSVWVLSYYEILLDSTLFSYMCSILRRCLGHVGTVDGCGWAGIADFSAWWSSNNKFIEIHKITKNMKGRTFLQGAYFCERGVSWIESR